MAPGRKAEKCEPPGGGPEAGKPDLARVTAPRGGQLVLKGTCWRSLVTVAGPALATGALGVTGSPRRRSAGEPWVVPGRSHGGAVGSPRGAAEERRLGCGEWGMWLWPADRRVKVRTAVATRAPPPREPPSQRESTNMMAITQ
ncbi:hypothetical protein NDU88_003541 [Pleurodeles waltl]|uniref:Uncharacterized protein n=1 Tax=Pleurodeles waltl TaxID=8319 RepID=A0AAV7RGI8_PLEWA|nr:hypothetical protein NDU88_003541 [Pleurodeles waltl]